MVSGLTATENERERAVLLSARSGQQLARAGLLVFVLLLFVRPSDWPALASLRLVLVVLTVTGAAFLISTRRFELFQHPASRWFLAFGGAVLLSIPASYSPTLSSEAFVDFGKQLFVYLLVINLAANWSMLAAMVAILVACCALEGGTAVYDFATLGVSQSERIKGVGYGMFGNANDLALTLLAMFPLAWWLLAEKHWKPARYLAATATLFMVAGFIVSESRGGYMGLAAAAIVLATQDRRVRRGLAVATILIVVGTSTLLTPGAFERVGTIASYETDVTALTRLGVWQSGRSMISDHPLLGVGANAFPIAYGADYRNLRVGRDRWAAHNTPIQLAAELGLPGLLTWLMVIAACVLAIRRTRRISLRADPTGTALFNLQGCLLASFTGYFVAGLFVSRGYDWTLTIMFGIAVAAERAAIANQRSRVGRSLKLADHS